MKITDQYLHLSIPGQTMGQTTGVATNSKGHLFVYSRSVNQGMARGGRAAMLVGVRRELQVRQRVGPQ